MNNTITHNLKIDNEVFPIHHVERRLYKFTSWRDAKPKLIKIIARRLQQSHGLEKVHVDFQMVNPLRKSRLGIFYLDIKAQIFDYNDKEKYIGNEETLGFKEIQIASYDVVDEQEKIILADRAMDSDKYKSEMYNKEFQERITSLQKKQEIALMSGLPNIPLSSLEERVRQDMESEGWKPDRDNRELFRISRCQTKNPGGSVILS